MSDKKDSPSATNGEYTNAEKALDKLADVHRGWCNYCKGDPLACLNAPAGGCSLRDYMMALGAPSETRPRILDEREVKEVAKKTGLPKYMWDTEEGRMDLARFAHEAALAVSAIRPSTESVASARYVLGDQPAHSLHERTLALEILRLAGEGR